MESCGLDALADGHNHKIAGDPKGLPSGLRHSGATVSPDFTDNLRLDQKCLDAVVPIHLDPLRRIEVVDLTSSRDYKTILF